MDDFKFTMISNYHACKLSDDDYLLQLFHQNTKHGNQYLMRNMFQSRTLLNNKNFLMASSVREKQYPLSEKVQLQNRTKDLLMDCMYNRRSQVKEHVTNYILTEEIISDIFLVGLWIEL